jgi:hypothetical protein
MRTYARMLAYHRHRQGFKNEQVCTALNTFGIVIHAALLKDKDIRISAEQIHDYLDLSLQLACDEVQDIYEQLHEIGDSERETFDSVNLLSNDLEMQRLIDEMNDICHDGWEIDALFQKSISHD